MAFNSSRRSTLVAGVLGLVLPGVPFGGACAMDVGEYKKLLEATVKETASGSIANPDSTTARLEQALKMAIDGARAYIGKDPTHSKVFTALIGSVDQLKKKPADDVETEWGEDGTQFAANGFDIKKNDQFSKAKSFIDVIVHPTLAISLLNEFRKSKDKALLERMKAELVEAVEHADHLN